MIKIGILNKQNIDPDTFEKALVQLRKEAATTSGVTTYGIMFQLQRNTITHNLFKKLVPEQGFSFELVDRVSNKLKFYFVTDKNQYKRIKRRRVCYRPNIKVT